MADLTIYILKYCGFCKRALNHVEEVLAENPELKQVGIELVDEAVERERARKLDYYYVPTFYIDDRKVHEGAVTRRHVESILREAYEVKNMKQ